MNRWATGTVLTATIVAAAGVGFWFGHDARTDPATAQPPTSEPDAAAPVASVRVAPASVTEIASEIEAYGTIAPLAGSSVPVSLPVEVRVERVRVAVGASVAAGDTLFEVGPTPEADLLLRQSKDALDATTRNLTAARARLAEQLATNADVATIEQAERAARTQFEALSARQAKSGQPVKSEVAGTVAQVNVQAGQIVPAGTALAVVAPEHVNEATLGVEPSSVGALKVGDAVPLADVQASADAPPVIGTIRLIASQLDAQTRLRNVSATLPADATLVPGTFVVGHLTVAKANGLTVPRSAVLPDDDAQVVFVVRDGKAVRQPIRVGLANRERVQVLGDALHEGDAVVTEGNTELEDGMAVQVEADAAGPNTMPAEDAK